MSALEMGFSIHLPPSILLYPIIMASAVCFGLSGGFITAAASVAMSWIWMLYPLGGFRILTVSDQAALVVFASVGVAINLATEAYRRRYRRIAALDAESVLNETKAKLDASLTSLAFFDPLTGLANRRLLMEQLNKSVALAARSDHKCALIFIDLDNFKTLNDTLGHQTGDLLLKEIAARLRASVRMSDTVGRWGGDEFVVVLEGLDASFECAALQSRRIADKMLEAVNAPCWLNGSRWTGSCSIGLTLYGGVRDEAGSIIQKADMAMYQAKASGRNKIFVFASALQQSISTRAQLEKELAAGIETGQFLLYYQPQFHYGKVVGVEALLRWNHPTRGILPPKEFISVAEETRLIIPLGKWVLESACRQSVEWKRHAETARISIAVNLSPVQLREQGFVNFVLSLIDQSGADSCSIRLELTESTLAKDMEDTASTMAALKMRGISFALDDFGTGYSSLAYLRCLPIDELKIDRSFVGDMTNGRGSIAIIKAIISLSESLGLRVVAEGVETEEQLKILSQLGCNVYQGYLFSPPLPVQEFERSLPDFSSARPFQMTPGTLSLAPQPHEMPQSIAGADSHKLIA